MTSKINPNVTIKIPTTPPADRLSVHPEKRTNIALRTNNEIKKAFHGGDCFFLYAETTMKSIIAKGNKNK